MRKYKTPRYSFRKPLTKETKEKISKSLQGENNPFYGHKHSEQTREKWSEIRKGSKLSEEHIRKITLAQKGIKRSEKFKNNLSEKRRGSQNPMWKGDKAGYAALHIWIRSHFWPTKLCQMCLEVPPLDLANITEIYNRDFRNWRYYCRSCHMKSDQRILNLKQYYSSCAVG